MVQWGLNQGTKLWGIRLILLSLVFLTSACWEEATETLGTTLVDNAPSDNNQIDAIDVDAIGIGDIAPTDESDSDVDPLDSPDVENSPVVFVPLPENQDTPIGIPNLVSTLVTVSDTAGVATVLGEGLEPGATIQFTNTTALGDSPLERESVSQTSFVEKLAAVFFNFVEVVVDEASQPALAVEDANQPCQQPHATCIQIDDDGVLPTTPLFNVRDSDSFNVSYVNLATGEIGPVVQEKITTSALYFGQKLDSSYTTSRNGFSAIVQASSDGNIVEVGFDAPSGLFKVRSGTLESNYSFARIPDEDLDGFTQMIYHPPTQHFILMNRREVVMHELVGAGDGHLFLTRKISSMIGCHDLCFPTKVKILDTERSLDSEDPLEGYLEELSEITSTGIYHDLRVNYIMGTRLQSVDYGKMGVLLANVGDLGGTYNSLNEVIFASADEHSYEDGTPIRFNHAEAFDVTASANNLLVQFEGDRGQKFLAVKSFLPQWLSIPSAILPVTWEKIIDLKIIKEQLPGDNGPGQALALTSDGLFPIAYNVFPKDGEAFIAIDESKGLKLGKDFAKMILDDERNLAFILDFGEGGGLGHDQKIIAIDLSDNSQPQIFHGLNPSVDPDRNGMIYLDEVMGKKLNYTPRGLELLKIPNADANFKNFLYVASNRLEGALVLNVSSDQANPDNNKTNDFSDEDMGFDKKDPGNLDNGDNGGDEPQKSIKLITETPISNFEKPSSGL